MAQGLECVYWILDRCIQVVLKQDTIGFLILISAIMILSKFFVVIIPNDTSHICKLPYQQKCFQLHHSEFSFLHWGL